MFPLSPKTNFIKIYAAAWIAVYLILLFFLRDYLPEKFLRDSLTIQSLADNTQAAADWGGAYSIAARMAGLFPMWALNLLVAAIGSTTIWLVVTSLRSIRGMLLVIPVLAPAILLDMVQFGKETFVIPLTLLIWRVAERVPSKAKAFGAIAAIYIVYGIFFREYYLIILASFAGILLFRRSAAPLRLAYVLVLLALLSFAVPAHVFEQLQGPRDEINRYSNLVTETVRTAIYNPFPPDNAYHFGLNYLYTFVKLNLPILFDHTLNEIDLFLNILIYGGLMFAGIRQRSMNATSMLPWLFLAHISVLIIFEPDAGSYFRHFSSVMLYLVPALRLVEDRYAQRQGPWTSTQDV